MGFFRQPSVIRRAVIYGVSVPLLLVVLSRAHSLGQNGPRPDSKPSLLTFDGIQHALLGATFTSKKPLDRDSNLELRRAIKDANARPDPGHSVREIPVHDSAGRPNYVPGQLIVRFHNSVSHRRQDQVIEGLGARILRTLDAHRGEYLVALPGGLSVPASAEQFAKLQEVDFIEPNILHYIDNAPSDELYASVGGQPTELQRWYFNGVGSDLNLDAEAAWNITTGVSNVVIAVIDTGIALEHPDLAANIWTNPGEVPGNGVDDDGDGFVDDVHGWDFYNDDNDPNPDLGDGSGDRNVFHGTFVAGCAAAVSDNHEGIAGTSWQSRLMPLKVFTNDGGAPASAIADAIRYAADHGANVINMSFSSAVPSKLIYNVIQEALDEGVILVAAAGNSNSNRRNYPAGFRGVIAVGGSGSGSALSGSLATMRSRASFSQFGPRAVDVVAPSVDIASTAVLSKTDELQGYGEAGSFDYFYGSGTSFAAPLVAGEVALLLAREHELGLDGAISSETIERIIVTATTSVGDDPTDSPDGGANWAGRGRVDFFAAVQQINPQLVTAPNPPRKLSANAGSPDSVELDWTDNSDNEQGFLIERARKDGKIVGSFELIAEVDPNVTSYTDTTAEPGATYLYRLAAVNPASTSYLRKPVTIIAP